MSPCGIPTGNQSTWVLLRAKGLGYMSCLFCDMGKGLGGWGLTFLSAQDLRVMVCIMAYFTSGLGSKTRHICRLLKRGVSFRGLYIGFGPYDDSVGMRYCEYARFRV